MAETFVHLKGLAANNFFKVNVLIFALYLLSFSCLVDWTSNMKYERDETCRADTLTPNQTLIPSGCRAEFKNREIQWFLDEGGHDWRTQVWWSLYVFTVLFLLAFTVREFLQLSSAGLKYFRSKENILEVVTLLCTWIYLSLVPLGLGYEIEQVFAVIAVFFAWIEMSMLIGRFPSIGIFAFMMFQVINQLIKFLAVYITTLIAFAHAFHLLLIRDETYETKEKNGVFDSFWSSTLKVTIFFFFSS